MRVTRMKKFKNLRKKQYKKAFLYFFVLPGVSILLGYIIRSLFILPLMTPK